MRPNHECESLTDTSDVCASVQEMRTTVTKCVGIDYTIVVLKEVLVIKFDEKCQICVAEANASYVLGIRL